MPHRDAGGRTRKDDCMKNNANKKKGAVEEEGFGEKKRCFGEKIGA